MELPKFVIMKGFEILKSMFGKSTMPMMPPAAGATPRRPVIAVAPDKFKGTLTAEEVTSIIAGALRDKLDAEVRCYPMADGGEGTAAILAAEMRLEPATAETHDAYMQPVKVQYFTDGQTAAVDSAAVVGLAMLGNRELDPWHATSYGLGEMLRQILDTGVREIYVGIGGTASTDGGAGMLQALGARFTDIWGKPVAADRPATAADLGNIFMVDFSGMDRRTLRERITVLADVDVPLTPAGTDLTDYNGLSAISFAVQKGMSADDLPDLARALDNFRHAVDVVLLPPAVQPPFQGAGGGLGYAFRRVLKCTAHAGAKYLAAQYGIFTADPQPDIVITGEGRVDEQSTGGKVVGTICDEAERRDIPAYIVAGSAGVRLPNMFDTSIYLGVRTPLNHSTAAASLRQMLPSIVSSVKCALSDAEKI